MEALLALGDINQEARLVRDLDLALRKKSRKEARDKWKKAMDVNDESTAATKHGCALSANKCDVWPGACRVCRSIVPSNDATTCDACQHQLFPEHMLLLKPVSDDVEVSLETLQESNRKMSETIEALKESSRKAEQLMQEVVSKLDSKLDVRMTRDSP